MSIRRQPRQYGLVLKCDAPGCTETFHTGQIIIRHVRDWVTSHLGWARMSSLAFGPDRKTDLCPTHAEVELVRRGERDKARKARADARAAGIRHVGPPPPGWAACARCGAHVLKLPDGTVRAHTAGRGRVVQRGSGVCGVASPAAEQAVSQW